MKFLGHLDAGYPNMEDMMDDVAVDVGPDNGAARGLHSTPQPPSGSGTGRAPPGRDGAHDGAAPEERAAASDVDRSQSSCATPTSPNPPARERAANDYRIIAALAAQAGEIGRDGIAAFARSPGLPGNSATQGDIASALPYLPHA